MEVRGQDVRGRSERASEVFKDERRVGPISDVTAREVIAVNDLGSRVTPRQIPGRSVAEVALTSTTGRCAADTIFTALMPSAEKGLTRGGRVRRASPNLTSYFILAPDPPGASLVPAAARSLELRASFRDIFRHHSHTSARSKVCPSWFPHLKPNSVLLGVPSLPTLSFPVNARILLRGTVYWKETNNGANGG